MMRRPYRPAPATLTAQHPLLRLETWAVFVTIVGMIVNEWLGPGFLALALLLWGLYGAQHASSVARALGSVGMIPWLLPLLAFVSLLWSPVPLATARAAIQFGLTIALAVLTARSVPPQRFVAGAWIVTGLLIVLSIAFNKPYRDAMTGIVSMGGVFGNKNTLAFCCLIFTLTSATIALDKARTLQFRLAGLLGILFGLVMCVLARSIGTIVVTFIGLGVLAITVLLGLLPRRLRSGTAQMVFVLGLLASVPLVMGVMAFQEELLALVNKDSTLTGRTLLWYHAARMWVDHPILGTGYHGFWVQGMPAAEFLWKELHIAARQGFHFHSLYYETLINLGLVGVALGLLVICQATLAALRWARRSPDASNGLCLGVILLSLVMQVQTIGLFSQFDPSSYIFFTCAAYAIGWCRQETAVRQRLRLPSRRLITGHHVRPA
ncbi:O-antigen ligase family protein [Roseicella aquatilis]|nr:O-antigen ligase [Roseicella aquatilis]